MAALFICTLWWEKNTVRFIKLSSLPVVFFENDTTFGMHF